MSDFGYRTTARQVVEGVNLEGKHAVVTGGYSGIGLETVRALALAGATVTMACRDLPRAQATATELNAESASGRVLAAEIDLGSLASIESFSRKYRTGDHALDLLINNAAVMACPFGKTADGFETQFGTNHLGHFSLFRLLLPMLELSGSARVVCLSSTGHFRSPVVFEDVNFERREYDPWAGYGQAKTANALMAVGIQDRYAGHGIEAFAVHPGGIMTTLQRHMSTEDIQSRGWVDAKGKVNERFKTVEQGAATSVWAATATTIADRGGRYLEDCGEATIHDARPEALTGVMRYAVDPENADRLWQLSLDLLAS